MAVGPAANTRAARPTVHEVLRSALLRAVLPALVMFGLLLGIGKALMAVFHEVPSEERISQKVAAERDGVLNSVTKVVSTVNDTWFTIGGAIVIGLVLLALTRKWWLSVVPLLAISLEASVFVPVTHLVGRPRPEVGRLDNAPPTSSFPSGHTAASFALFWSLAMLATRIENSACDAPCRRCASSFRSAWAPHVFTAACTTSATSCSVASSASGAPSRPTLLFERRIAMPPNVRWIEGG